MMKEFLKGDLINSHSFQADGLSNRSTDANNSTVKIHHLEANPLLLAGVPDSSSGTGEWEKEIPSFQTTLSCFVEKNLQVTARACTSVQCHHVSHNDPRISFTVNMNCKFWCSPCRGTLRSAVPAISACAQMITSLPMISRVLWGTHSNSLTNRKRWAKRIEMGQCVMSLRSIARQRWITLDKSLANIDKAFFETSWQDKNNFRSSSVQE